MKVEQNGDLAQMLANEVLKFKRMALKYGTYKGLKKSDLMLIGNLYYLTLNNPEGIGASKISKMLEITPAAVTHTLNSIESKGYIERRPDIYDKRIVMVRLTEKGLELAKMVRDEFLNTFQKVINTLGEEKSTQLVGLLDETLHVMEGRKSLN